MKSKHFSLFFGMSLALLLASCGGASSSDSSSETPSSSETSSSVVPSSSSQISSSSQDLPDFDPASVKDNLIIHYHRDDADYLSYRLWIWDHGNGGNGVEYVANGKDSYGSVYSYPLTTWASGNFSKLDLGVIVKTIGTDTDPWASGVTKDVEQDRFMVLSNLHMDEHGNYAVWLWTGVSAIYKTEPSSPFFVQSATLKDFNKLVVTAGNGKFKKIDLYEDGALKESFDVAGLAIANLTLSTPADLTHSYHVMATFTDGFEIEGAVDVSSLYEAESFKELYDYDGSDLGANYTQEETTFKVWSPFSTKITLKVFASGTPVSIDAERGSDECDNYEMTKGERGVWSVTVPGDLEGKYYTYEVTNFKWTNKQIVDPYAKSCGINGLRGMIVDFSKTNPSGWDEFELPYQYQKTGTVVYETHIQDQTSSSTWGGDVSKAKKYSGFHLSGTTYTEAGKTVSTGFDHIKELGVNAVQLQPIYDQANEERPELQSFNWGYNPQNYNCLEGAYSSDPYDGYARIKEFKELVKDYHDAGINIIMDVVYNHVNSVEGLNFDVLAPGYFFRYSPDGALSNGSGCGNETASNHSMFRKFMIDSTKFWAEEYKLGGFRFDLMALHDLETMDQLTASLQEINPNIIVYGEPWAGGSSMLPPSEAASQANADKYKGYGQFNDGMRDALVKGGMKGEEEAGLVWNKLSKPLTSDATKVTAGLRGFTSSTGTVRDSLKTVNYVSCHDNYTINDRVLGYERKASVNMQIEKTSEAERAQINLLAQSFAMLSQGTSFMLGGEEMLRSKYELTPDSLPENDRFSLAHNSYTSSFVDGKLVADGYIFNAIDYSRKIKFPELEEGYKKLIEMKKTFSGLQLDLHKTADRGDNSSEFTVDYDRTNCNQFTYEIKNEDASYRVVLSAPYGEHKAVDLSGYSVYYSSVDRKSVDENTIPEPYEVLVAKQNA